MLEAKRLVIRGRVQGVGFRFFVEDVATREGLSGYVRNQPDGTVETLVQGEVDAVARFERAVRRGPPGARVESVEVEPAAPAETHLGFSIRP